jgi:hypothetical protein
MKKSTAVTLVISGALMAGCNDQYGGNGDWSSGYEQSGTNAITNNTYAPGYGYWHAPYRGWYPYPYNFYRPGFGYFHGGNYSDEPEASPITRSFPRFTSGGGAAHGGSWFSGSHSGISRGGFGGSAHFGGS